MRYYGNEANIARTAALTVTNFLASDAVYQSEPPTREGGGNVALTGSYTGAEDATFDVEILNDTIVGDPTISEPVFSGVGNGTMDSITATGLSAQVVTVELRDLGTRTQAASVAFQGGAIVARATGTGGNAITVSIDQSGITRTATDFALHADLQQDVNEYAGQQWDFGAPALESDGSIPADAPRVGFGDDPQVYRLFKRFRGGRDVFSFSPAPVRTVPAGSRVYAVTGSRSVTVTDGVTPETYNSVVTLYDLLNAIQSTSALVEFSGVVSNDRLPGGMGIDDLSVYTDPYYEAITRQGTQFVQRAAIDLELGPNSPTETLTIRCTDASTRGSELWEVYGSISGALSDAITAVLYSGENYSFTIPEAAYDASAPTGRLLARLQLESRAEGDTVPSMCLDRGILGAEAVNGTFVFEYRPRPAASCDCRTGNLIGGPDDDCLGIDVEGDMAVQPGWQQARERRVRDWYASATAAQRMMRLSAAGQVDGGNGTDSQFDIDTTTDEARALPDLDSLIFQQFRREAIQALVDLSTGTLEYTAWAAATAYDEDDIREPTVRNGYLYRATDSGTSDAGEPTWPTTIGDTVVDNGVTWECWSRIPTYEWDDLYTAVTGELAPLINAPASFWHEPQTRTAWVTATAYAIGDVIIPTTANGHRYICYDAGTSGGVEPTWPTNGTTVADGTAGWRDMGAYWNASTDVEVGDYAYPGADVWRYGAAAAFQPPWRCITAGTTGAAEPDWAQGVNGLSVTDGTAMWEPVGVDAEYDLYASPPSLSVQAVMWEEKLRMYGESIRARFDAVLSAAGVTRDFESTGTTAGDGCWVDRQPGYWFEDVSGRLLPIQVGYGYHSAVLTNDPDTGDPVVESTREFFVGLRFGCPDSLVVGDRIIITLEGITNPRQTYQVGDTFEIRTVFAADLALSGGQTGDDTLTWAVTGSVDGAFADYALDLTAPVAYSDGGLGFDITEGAIAFDLGDRFTFQLEGGQFRWRKDAGAWSAATQIAATVALSDGLSAAFVPGAAPSFVAGDSYAFSAEAINGPEQLRSPVDGRCEWQTSTVITIDPGSSEPLRDLCIMDHAIPSTASILLEGSDDNFATSPLSQSITWNATHIAHVLGAQVAYAKYRLTIDDAGSIGWLWAGVPLQAEIEGGKVEHGFVTMRRRLAGVSNRKARGFSVRHELLTYESAELIAAAFDWAAEYDQGRLGVMVSEARPTEAQMVTLDGDTIEIEDALGYQPTDNGRLYQTLTLELQPVLT